MTDITITPKQALWVATAALERIKDAPISKEEIEETSRDALHIIHWGFREFETLGHWGKSLYGHLPNKQ